MDLRHKNTVDYKALHNVGTTQTSTMSDSELKDPMKAANAGDNQKDTHAQKNEADGVNLELDGAEGDLHDKDPATEELVGEMEEQLKKLEL